MRRKIIMCSANLSQIRPCSPIIVALRNRIQPSKGYNLRYLTLNRRRRSLTKAAKAKRKSAEAVKKEMEMRNLKLYMENKSIIEENEKLRKRASLLHQENQALLSLIQHKNFSVLASQQQ